MVLDSNSNQMYSSYRHKTLDLKKYSRTFQVNAARAGDVTCLNNTVFSQTPGSGKGRSLRLL